MEELLTRPRARNLRNIWGREVEWRTMEGVGFITGRRSIWYSLGRVRARWPPSGPHLSVLDTYILEMSGYRGYAIRNRAMSTCRAESWCCMRWVEVTLPSHSP